MDPDERRTLALMSNSSHQICTPVGNLQIAADVLGLLQSAPIFEVFAYQPTLPPGMSVAACHAIVLSLPGADTDTEVRVSATLIPMVSVDSGADTGEGLEAQSWQGENHLLLLGTEDSEYLKARLPNQVRVTDSSFSYAHHSFSLEFTRCHGRVPIELLFLLAWNELPDPQDCSCWYAVNQGHAYVLSALRSNSSLGADTPQQNAAPRDLLRAGQRQR